MKDIFFCQNVAMFGGIKHGMLGENESSNTYKLPMIKDGSNQ
jgi:hypothetical protein